MKCFLISYTFTEGSEDEWHEDINRFIAALENDPEIGGCIRYRVLKSTKGPQYFHIATPASEDAAKKLSEKDFFKKYTERTDFVSGGTVEVTPLTLIAETQDITH